MQNAWIVLLASKQRDNTHECAREWAHHQYILKERALPRTFNSLFECLSVEIRLCVTDFRTNSGNARERKKTHEIKIDELIWGVRCFKICCVVADDLKWGPTRKKSGRVKWTGWHLLSELYYVVCSIDCIVYVCMFVEWESQTFCSLSFGFCFLFIKSFIT